MHGWDAARGQYETEAEFRTRMALDISRISDKIRRATGRAPRVWVWPYGAVSGTTLHIMAEDGYEMALTLEDGPARVQNLMSVPRLLLSNAPGLPEFAQSLIATERNQKLMRAVHIDLDSLYDPDPAQTERNLDALVQRIFDLSVNTVFLQAFAKPEGDGVVRALYFPNRHLPMRADLFNRVAWQVHSRASVDVYAWLPVLALDLAAELPRVEAAQAHAPQPAPALARAPYQRLSPFDAQVREHIGELYEDLARHAFFDGILFHDDALLGEAEDASPAALAAYRAAGFAMTNTQDLMDLRQHPAQHHAWSRFKSATLIDFTRELAEKVRAIRGPHIRTVRCLYAAPILDPQAEAAYAQNLGDFLAAYDWIAPMAMPRLANVPPEKELAWLDALVDAVAAHPGALDKTVFALQARDWRGPADNAIATHVLAGWMSRLQQRGARSFGYYPDDFAANAPRLHGIRPALSSAWHPFD